MRTKTYGLSPMCKQFSEIVASGRVCPPRENRRLIQQPLVSEQERRNARIRDMQRAPDGAQGKKIKNGIRKGRNERRHRRYTRPS